jgi:L-fuculose-phosphate aldolase
MAEMYMGVKFQVEKNALEKRMAVDESNKELTREMISYAKRMSRLGLTPGNAGNISARTKEGILVKATGCEMGDLNPEDFTLVKEFDFEDFKLKKAVGLRLPSSETPMHCLIYKKRKDVNSVVHVHGEIFLRKESYKKFGINSTPAGHPYGSMESAQAAVEALGRNKAAVLRNHGIVSVGMNVREAAENILMMLDEISP